MFRSGQFFENCTLNHTTKEQQVPLTHTPASEELFKSGLLSNTPVQARSNARVTALLDAAATVIHDKGYEELTTADIAAVAGASIGTVYRYFEDRVKVLEALAIRNVERTDIRFREALEGVSGSSPADATNAIFEVYLAMFRTEPGFRSLRFGDVLDIRPRPFAPRMRTAARTVATAFSGKFGFTDTDDNILELEKSIVVADAFLARAFFNNDEGDPAFIAAAREAAVSLSRLAT